MNRLNASNRSSINPLLSDEAKEQNNKHTLSKFEYDLYHDEDNIAAPVTRIKRTSSAGSKNEKWKIFENNKTVLCLEAESLTTSEREFLRTAQGLNFVLSKYKSGITSATDLKLEIEKKLK